MRALLPSRLGTVLALVVAAAALAGCVGPTGNPECHAPPPTGDVAFVIETQDGSARDVPATEPTRWSLMVTCSEEARPVANLAIRVETSEHGTLVAEGELTLPNDGTLTLYAAVGGSGGNDSTLFSEDLPQGGGPAYRLRISDDRRSFEGLDERDQLALTYDAGGRGSFTSQLPLGSYVLTVRDASDRSELGGVSHRFFDPGIDRTEDQTQPPPSRDHGQDE